MVFQYISFYLLYIVLSLSQQHSILCSQCYSSLLPSY